MVSAQWLHTAGSAGLGQSWLERTSATGLLPMDPVDEQLCKDSVSRQLHAIADDGLARCCRNAASGVNGSESNSGQARRSHTHMG